MYLTRYQKEHIAGKFRFAEAMYVGDIAYAIPQGAHRMKVPLRGSDVRRKFIGDEFQGRVVREVEGAALEMRFASNRRNVGSNPMLSAHFINKNSTAVFDLPGAVFICQ